eukprot:Lithocolla_globosa_v1_NODE_2227_length_2101_cov_10.459922.p1 type:complete len:287 gc:universal NODE_2227_length_2101_cov_10.459922:213-1073(+)
MPMDDETTTGHDERSQSPRPTRITYATYDYTVKESSKTRHKCRCSHYRGTGCKAKLEQVILSGIIELKDEHTCRGTTIDEKVVDIKSEMSELANNYALNKLHLSAYKIWDELHCEMMKKYEDVPVVKHSRDFIINQINNCRRDNGAGDVFRMLETDRYARLGPANSRFFLQNTLTFNRPGKDGVPDKHRILIWSHPDLGRLLKYPGVPGYLDGSFRDSPKPFVQTVVLMLYDPVTSVFCPSVFSLHDCKLDWTYWHFLHFVVVISDHKFDPPSMGSISNRPIAAKW